MRQLLVVTLLVALTLGAAPAASTPALAQPFYARLAAQTVDGRLEVTVHLTTLDHVEGDLTLEVTGVAAAPPTPWHFVGEGRGEATQDHVFVLDLLGDGFWTLRTNTTSDRCMGSLCESWTLLGYDDARTHLTATYGGELLRQLPDADVAVRARARTLTPGFAQVEVLADPLSGWVQHAGLVLHVSGDQTRRDGSSSLYVTDEAELAAPPGDAVADSVLVAVAQGSRSAFSYDVYASIGGELYGRQVGCAHNVELEREGDALRMRKGDWCDPGTAYARHVEEDATTLAGLESSPSWAPGPWQELGPIRTSPGAGPATLLVMAVGLAAMLRRRGR